MVQLAVHFSFLQYGLRPIEAWFEPSLGCELLTIGARQHFDSSSKNDVDLNTVRGDETNDVLRANRNFRTGVTGETTLFNF